MCWPSFNRAARGMLTARVRVTASATVGSIHGAQDVDQGIVVDNLACSIQPSSAFENTTLLGRFTNATMLLFCSALDGNGKKWGIRKGHAVEEIAAGAVKRAWTVSDDPENYEGVFLVVPLHPARMKA